jgi:hypothetical protein
MAKAHIAFGKVSWNGQKDKQNLQNIKEKTKDPATRIH